MKISRRGFIAASTLLTACGLYEAARDQHETRSANELLEDLPDEMPGAVDVDKKPVIGARHCLVHVREGHYKETADDSQLELVRQIHSNIYLILSDLVNRQFMDSVYVEGVTVESEYQVNLLRDRVPDLYQSPYPWLASLDNDRLREIDVPKYLKDRKALELTLGGAGQLYWERKIRWLNAADSKLLKNIGTDKQREDYVLKLIAASHDPISFVVFGGAHTWADNIPEWNAKHPEISFSLVEVTPAKVPPYNVLWQQAKN